MNARLTWTAALAVFLSSFSLLTVITGIGWLYAGLGAVVVVACAGLATRSGPVPSAVIAAVLTLIAVGPLLAGPGWSPRIIGLAIVAVVGASAGVRRVLPALASLVTYLAALLLYLNLVFARALSTAWIVPTAHSLHALTKLASVGYDLHNYAPPVPSIAGIELISAAGIGAVAIITDLIAVRLRSPAVAGLPLLVLFSVPVATNVKNATVGLTLAFCLGITGYLAMLATDGRQRLRLWGRLVTVWEETPDEEGKGPDTRQLAASGRRVGLTAVAFAIVIPLILPGLREHGIFARSTTPGHGTQSATPPSPLVEMRSQLESHSAVPVLTYRTTAANPPQQYLQVYVLSDYDARDQEFTLPDHIPSTSVGSGPLQSPPGLGAAVSTLDSSTSVTMSKTAKGYLSYLPAPYAPETLKVPGSNWYETKKTLMLWGYRPTAGLQYTVTSRTPEVFQNQLPTKYQVPASLKPYLTYSNPDKLQLLAIAQNVTRHAHTMFAKALALQYWFTTTGGFTYTLHDAATNTVAFLTNDKYGFCQQYALAMAVLARLLGIPSRVAVGYTAGTRAGHGVWKVTTADAHAWPELYFPTIGWTRFEPTPGGPAAQGTATRPNYPSVEPPITPGGPTEAPTLPVSTKGASQGGPDNRVNQRLLGTGAGAGKHSGRGSGGFPIGLVVAIVAAVLLVAPSLTRAGTRRRRWLTAGGDLAVAHAAWRELNSTLTDYGLDGPVSESPRALARRVTDAAGLDEPARQALGRVASAEERARYARSPAAGATLRADELVVRRAVARHATRWQRWRARLLPASTLDPVWAAARQAPDVFGWLDAAALRMRRSVLGSRDVRRTA
jgi:transglutaminase-like putative cysteine protease